VTFQVGGKDFGEEPDDTPDFSETSLLALRELENDDPDEYGKSLFQCAFSPRSREGLRTGIHHIEAQGGRARLQLKIDHNAQRLHGLMWEALVDPGPPPTPFAISPTVALSRYVAVPASKDIPRDSKLRVLVVVANPGGLGSGHWSRFQALAEDEEKAVINEALAPLGDRVEYVFLPRPASLEAIRSALRDEGFHVLHVVGHGSFSTETQKSTLLLESEDGQSVKQVDGKELGQLFLVLPKLSLVVLASCHSGNEAQVEPNVDFDRTEPLGGIGRQVVRAGVPAVVALRGQVAVETAQRFSGRFYESLAGSRAAGGVIDVAVNDARDRIGASRFREWDWTFPIVFMRGEGIVFNPIEDVVVNGNIRTSPLQAAPNLPEAPQNSSASAPSPEGRAWIRRKLQDLILIEHSFSPEDLETLCFRLGIEYTTLSQSPISATVRDLISLCEPDRIDELKVEIGALVDIRGRYQASVMEKDPASFGPAS
jgi:CHAT domain